MEYEKSGITSEDVKRYANLVKDPSTVTIRDSENLAPGAQTGSTGERDMHSDATSEKQYADEGGSAPMVPDLKPTTEHSYGGGLYGTEKTPSPRGAGHASDFQSAEGLEADMPDRSHIREPPSSGNRATDITGISYFQ